LKAFPLSSAERWWMPLSLRTVCPMRALLALLKVLIILNRIGFAELRAKSHV
jgi:hypothetical protein